MASHIPSLRRPSALLLQVSILIFSINYWSCLGLTDEQEQRNTTATDLANSVGTKAFLNSIFQLYAGGQNKTMSQAQFKTLLQNLSVGSVVVERPDKYCKYKGVHLGLESEQGRPDSVAYRTVSLASKSRSTVEKVSNFAASHVGEVGEEMGELLRRGGRPRRSGGGDHDHNKKKVTESHEHSQHLQKHFQQCLSRHRIFEQHNLNENASITPEILLRLCPALLHQAAGAYCIHRHNCSEPPIYYTTEVQTKSVWLYGFVAVTFVSLASLCIIALIPCLKKGFYQRVMGYLVALAVGTLAGDALLHLIPHAFQSQTTGTLEVDHKKNIWKSCFILLGIYSFFLVEQLMKIKDFCRNKEKIPANDKGEVNVGGTASLDLQSDDSHTELKPFSSENGDNHDPHAHLEKHDHHKNPHDLEHNHGHSHGVIDEKTSIASVAWMVIVGDGFHNFSDGLAIGAAFAASYTSGVSTAIAVFCHELPHELGDFAVLIKSGMSIKQAIFYNIVSALLSYIGLVIGIVVGNYSNDGKQFALALTAGLFLYVALATMLPELTSTVEDDAGDTWSFISPHLGIITGFVIMLLISLFEDKF
eukprot:gene3594-4101_t